MMAGQKGQSMRKKERYFVKVWRWNDEEQENIPEMRFFHTAEQAKATFDRITINNDTPGASYGMCEPKFETYDWKPI